MFALYSRIYLTNTEYDVNDLWHFISQRSVVHFEDWFIFADVYKWQYFNAIMDIILGVHRYVWTLVFVNSNLKTTTLCNYSSREKQVFI